MKVNIKLLKMVKLDKLSSIILYLKFLNLYQAACLTRLVLYINLVAHWLFFSGSKVEKNTKI
ncbi:MAG: hypothetical protein EB079_00145 [Verrucomicrobia bacterium]|nr:hypothetical protein [Verrucomicrobiota bacterium]